jgi:hypothetical protein
MVPRIGGQGSSFKGAAAYYLHDKEADTSERVAFTYSHNLSTDDPEMAWRWMAKTALDAERLKAASGADMRGAKSAKPVFTFSLSWHPDEEPDDAHMVETMERALENLGLRDHQALMVSHRDEPQPHIHAIVNLIHPETGKTAPLKFSKEKLSKFAQAYEEEHGIYCEQRIHNNAKRAQEQQRREEMPAEDRKSVKAAFARHKETEHALKAQIAARYMASDSGSAFRSSLQEMGFSLAQGRRIVVVDASGKEYSLARQLAGVKAKDLRARLADIELPHLDDLRREIQERSDRQQAAAAANAGKREKKADEKASKVDPAQDRSSRLNDIQDRRRDALDELGAKHDQARGTLEKTIEKQYGDDEQRLRAGIVRRETMFQKASRVGSWFLRTFAKEEERLEADRRSLVNLEQRKGEMTGALQAQAKSEREDTQERFERERQGAEFRFGFNDRAQADELRRAQEANPLNAVFSHAAKPAPSQESAPTSLSANNDASGYSARRAAYMERAITEREALEAEEREGPSLSEGD